MATQPTTGIGSVEETNRLLQEASRQTGIQAPTFSPTGAITSSVLSENEPSIQLPDITPSTISGRIDGQSTALLEFDALEQKAAQKVEEDRVKLQESQTKSASFLEQLGIKKKEVTGQVEEEFGLAGLKELKKTALQGLRKAQVSELGEIERLQTQNLTAVGAQAAEAGIRRKYGFEKLEAQLSYYMATDNITSVEATLNDRLTLELEPLYQQLEMQKGVSEQIYDQLTTSEKREWDLAISKTENSIQERKDIATYRNGIITTAMQNGVPLPSYVVQELNRAGSVEEVNQILARNGISLQSTAQRLQEQKLRLDIEKARIDLQDTINLGVVASGEYGSVINTASNLLGSEKAKQSRKDIASAIANGDYTTAYATVANNVEQALTGEVKTRFASQRNDYATMSGLRTAIQQYADTGGDMGLLKGKEEEIKRKLGIDSGNASSLAVQLWREFQTYRVNMTGAAFSATESADYASVNPTLGKSLNLNLSVIDGAMNQLENRITSTIETRVPGANTLYQKINPEASMTDDEAYQLYLEILQTP